MLGSIRAIKLNVTIGSGLTRNSRNYKCVRRAVSLGNSLPVPSLRECNGGEEIEYSEQTYEKNVAQQYAVSVL